jgi:hypothetical protein
MTSRFLVKARAGWLLGIVLLGAGLLSLLYMSALLSWQVTGRLETGAWVPLPAALLFQADAAPRFLPEFPPAWLAAVEAWPQLRGALLWGLQGLHAGLVFALPGAALAVLGVLMTRRRAALLSTEARRQEDRLRRLRQYRDNSRREPFIGRGTGM